MENNKQEHFLDKMGISFHRSLSFKLVVIAILAMLLLIPKFMILSLVNERSASADIATRDVMSKWSNEQTITGPILYLPYIKNVYNEKDESYETVRETAIFLPKTLKINGDIQPQKLYRSIYNVVVYESDIALSGSFEALKLEELSIDPALVRWNEAKLLLNISDLRGISEEVTLKWNKNELTFSPGVPKISNRNTGISVPLPQLQAEDLQGTFHIDLKLKGSRQLCFSPIGEKTDVALHSTWNDPSFVGNFLPKDRQINSDGFNAKWSVLHFNRNFPQQWILHSGNNSNRINNSDFGVELVMMADHYQKNTRSAKYSILVILITFMVFFLYEVFSKQRIHTFQYLMAGMAITIFYLLLLSFSEHVGFNMAYIISTGLILIMTFLYSRTFMPKLKNSFGVSSALAFCYGFVFILLQLESFALLVGSIGLFVLLALLMYVTRRINW